MQEEIDDWVDQLPDGSAAQLWCNVAFVVEALFPILRCCSEVEVQPFPGFGVDAGFALPVDAARSVADALWKRARGRDVEISALPELLRVVMLLPMCVPQTACESAAYALLQELWKASSLAIPVGRDFEVEEVVDRVSAMMDASLDIEPAFFAAVLAGQLKYLREKTLVDWPERELEVCIERTRSDARAFAEALTRPLAQLCAMSP